MWSHLHERYYLGLLCFIIWNEMFCFYYIALFTLIHSSLRNDPMCLLPTFTVPFVSGWCPENIGLGSGAKHSVKLGQELSSNGLHSNCNLTNASFQWNINEPWRTCRLSFKVKCLINWFVFFNCKVVHTVWKLLHAINKRLHRLFLSLLQKKTVHDVPVCDMM